MSSNPIVFWELASHNAEKSVEFFKKAFGWQIDYDKETGIHYIPILKEENKFSGGGVFTLRRAKLPFLTLYIEVEDIDKTAKQLEQLGAFIVEPPIDITPRSRICLFNEPSGVTFALIQRKK
ncbi:MAG: VOC family protein [bacterium]|nr:VOC family protein [candidate division WOR-3 bacterium]